MTFSMTLAPGCVLPPVARLTSDRNVDAQDVSRHKMEMDDLKSLLEHWR
jgi:hypothetical protein